jgi:hypothetical protein
MKVFQMQYTQLKSYRSLRNAVLFCTELTPKCTLCEFFFFVTVSVFLLLHLSECSSNRSTIVASDAMILNRSTIV